MQVDPGLSFEGDGRATKKFANGCGQIGGGRRIGRVQFCLGFRVQLLFRFRNCNGSVSAKGYGCSLKLSTS